jgi:hypothetical protein
MKLSIRYSLQQMQPLLQSQKVRLLLLLQELLYIHRQVLQHVSTDLKKYSQ